MAFTIKNTKWHYGIMALYVCSGIHYVESLPF